MSFCSPVYGVQSERLVLSCSLHSVFLLVSCVFDGFSSTSAAGSVQCDVSGSNLEISKCSFSRSTGYIGGAISTTKSSHIYLQRSCFYDVHSSSLGQIMYSSAGSSDIYMIGGIGVTKWAAGHSLLYISLSKSTVTHSNITEYHIASNNVVNFNGCPLGNAKYNTFSRNSYGILVEHFKCPNGYYSQTVNANNTEWPNIYSMLYNFESPAVLFEDLVFIDCKWKILIWQNPENIINSVFYSCLFENYPSSIHTVNQYPSTSVYHHLKAYSCDAMNPITEAFTSIVLTSINPLLTLVLLTLI